MNQDASVSVDKTTSVIVDHDGSFQFITKVQEAFLKIAQEKGLDSVWTPGLGMLKFSGVKKILSIQKFYEQYPQHRPEETRTYQTVNEQIRTPTEKAKELMRQGFVEAMVKKGYAEDDAKKQFNRFTQIE